GGAVVVVGAAGGDLDDGDEEPRPVQEHVDVAHAKQPEGAAGDIHVAGMIEDEGRRMNAGLYRVTEMIGSGGGDETIFRAERSGRRNEPRPTRADRTAPIR